jgi:hypothetical protein
MTALEQTQPATGAITAATHAHHGGHSRRRFVGHFIEMQVAMMAGMAVGGPLGIPGVASTELKAGLWMIVMVVPMVSWMRLRGMAWRPIAEMSASMIIPTVVLLPVLWLGLITGKMLIGFEHVSMAPAMLALMVYRRRAYGW